MCFESYVDALSRQQRLPYGIVDLIDVTSIPYHKLCYILIIKLR